MTDHFLTIIVQYLTASRKGGMTDHLSNIILKQASGKLVLNKTSAY